MEIFKVALDFYLIFVFIVDGLRQVEITLQNGLRILHYCLVHVFEELSLFVYLR